MGGCANLHKYFIDKPAEAVSFVSIAFMRVSRSYFHSNPIRNPICRSVPAFGPRLFNAYLVSIGHRHWPNRVKMAFTLVPSAALGSVSVTPVSPHQYPLKAQT